MCASLRNTLFLALIFQIVAIYNAIPHETDDDAFAPIDIASGAPSAAGGPGDTSSTTTLRSLRRLSEADVDEWAMVGVLYLGSPLLLLIYTIFPYSCFQVRTGQGSGGTRYIKPHPSIPPTLSLTLECFPFTFPPPPTCAVVRQRRRAHRSDARIGRHTS